MLTFIHRRMDRAARSRGVTMIEVLVALLILTVGLLGVAGLQARMQTAEIEAFQRAQAITLLQDMVSRINANRVNAATYATAAVTLGTGTALDCVGTPPTNVMERDKCAWSAALIGSGETKSSVKIGAMNEARGCITVPVTTMPREVVVAVVWQGIASTVVPTATACGSGNAAYGSDGKLRRALVARIKIACLQNDPSTGACVTL